MTTLVVGLLIIGVIAIVFGFGWFVVYGFMTPADRGGFGAGGFGLAPIGMLIMFVGGLLTTVGLLFGGNVIAKTFIPGWPF